MRKGMLAGVVVTMAAAGAMWGLAGCGSTGSREGPRAAVAPLESASGSRLKGTATFTRMAGGWIECRITVSGVEPGMHAVHIHEKGDCTSGDGKSTGGHWNPTGKKHGRWDQPDGEFHLGDLGNMEVGPDGTGTFVRTSGLWSIGGTGLNDILGKAIIVHGGADDFVTDPTGNAGNRIGCGVIVAAP